MTIWQLIKELEKLGNEYSFEHYLQFSGCYGATTEMLYLEQASEVDLLLGKGINIPTDLCSG